MAIEEFQVQQNKSKSVNNPDNQNMKKDDF